MPARVDSRASYPLAWSGGRCAPASQSWRPCQPARGRPGRGEAAAADPAQPEAAAGMLELDLDLVDELDACRRPELIPKAADAALFTRPAAARGSGLTRRGPAAAVRA
jgi:hypothetical protein